MAQADPLLKVDEIISMYKNMDRNVFLTRFDYPVLVASMIGVGEDGRPGSQIWQISKSTVMEGKKASSTNVITLVIPLEKASTSGDRNRFTMGRGTENDIIVPNPSVSRRHACIEVDPMAEGGAKVMDTGSSYGTTMDGKALAPDQPVPLHTGAVIVLGQSAYCTFLSPKDFYDYIGGLIRARGG
jgi:hypothetical protein